MFTSTATALLPRFFLSRKATRATLVLTGIASLALTACNSPDSRSGGRNRTPQPRLAGEMHFLADALTAHVTLGSLELVSGGGPSGDGAGHRSGGRRHHGGMERSSGADDGGTGAEANPNLQARAPRLTMRVSFTNQGQQRLEFSVPDVISELGNFAVRPEKLALNPGETGELEPMNSSYPAVIDELTVEIRLRQDGKMETHSVRLLPEPPKN